MNLRNRFLSIVAANAVALLVCAAVQAESTDPDDRAHPMATGETLDAIDVAFTEAVSDSYATAVADVANAPSYCVVVYVEPNATHGWRAVCDLLGNDESPTTIRDRAGSVVYESTEAEPSEECYFEAGETICPLVIVAFAE